MAKKQVRYRVLKPAFVNASYIDPKGAKDVFILADEGLEGAALELAPETPPTPKKPAGKPKEPAGASGVILVGDQPADKATADSQGQ